MTTLMQKIRSRENDDQKGVLFAFFVVLRLSILVLIPQSDGDVAAFHTSLKAGKFSYSIPPFT